MGFITDVLVCRWYPLDMATHRAASNLRIADNYQIRLVVSDTQFPQLTDVDCALSHD